MKKSKIFSPSRVAGNKSFDPNKGSQELYKTKEWTDYRFRFLHHNPKCYICDGPSRVVDHIKSHKGDVKLFEQNDNHMPACSSCHSTFTQLFDKYDPPKTQEKIAWIINKRKFNGVESRVKVIPYKK